MGKLLYALILLVFLDLFFIATGQICSQETCTISSTMLNSILEPGSFTFSNFFNQILGSIGSLFSSSSGIWSLLVGGGVLLGTLLAARDFRFSLIPIAITLGVLSSDFIIIFAYLYPLSPLLATMVLAPLLVTYAFVVLEWVIGKD